MTDTTAPTAPALPDAAEGILGRWAEVQLHRPDAYLRLDGPVLHWWECGAGIGLALHDSDGYGGASLVISPDAVASLLAGDALDLGDTTVRLRPRALEEPREGARR
jgi:hypothetical protein